MQRCSFLVARATLSVALGVLFCASSHASTWTETGDAGDAPGGAQITSGASPLTEISGTLPGTFDIDMYQINIVDHANFSADISPLVVTVDPDIWLFDSAGNGVTMDDSVHGGAATISGADVPSNGLYYLVVSSDGADALSAGGKIWLSPPGSGQRTPDGPGAGQPFISWGGSPLNDDMHSYNVFLNGVNPVLAPEPASLSVLMLSGIGMLRRRAK
jgi:hypothetical protein